MKIMIVNSKTKQKPKTILGRIRNLVLDFVLRKYPIHVTWAQGKATIHYASLEELSKKKTYEKQFTTVTTQKCSKLLQWKMCKVFNVWPKKIQRSYLLWHWRVMQNLKKNWLVVWKMRNMANFHQSNWKSQNWDIDGIL